MCACTLHCTAYISRYSADQVAKLAPLRPPHVANKPKYHDGIIKYRNLESLNQTFFNKINAIYLGQVSYVDWVGDKQKWPRAQPVQYFELKCS